MPNFWSFGTNNWHRESVYDAEKARQIWKIGCVVITQHQAVLFILTVVAIIQMHEVLIADDYRLMDFQ